MAAVTITPSEVTGEILQREGQRLTKIITLTMVASTSTYTDGGLADATNFSNTTGSEWWRKYLGNSLKVVQPVDTQLRSSDFETSYVYEVDITNGKLILYGLRATPAESQGLSEVANAASLVDGTYTAKVKLIGY